MSGNGPQTILLEARDFKKGKKRKKGRANGEDDQALEWSEITTFTITLTDDTTKRKINLASLGGAGVLKRIELVKP